MRNAKSLFQERGNAFVRWMRSVIGADFGTELDWHSGTFEHVLGAVVLDDGAVRVSAERPGLSERHLFTPVVPKARKQFAFDIFVFEWHY